MIRVVVADDQDLVRAGIVASIANQPDMSIVAEVGDGTQAVAAVLTHRPDVVLLDIRMPGLDGIATAARILGRPGPPKVIMLTTFDFDEYVDAALRLRVSGFLVKDASVEELAEAVRAAHRGDAVLSPSVTKKVVARMLEHAPDRRASAAAAAAANEVAVLSPRETEIVRFIAQGMSNAEISQSVHLSEATVKTYVGQVLGKLELRDRVQVAVWAHRHGLG